MWPRRKPKKTVELEKNPDDLIFREAQNQRRTTESRGPEVIRLMNHLRVLDEGNHYSQLITEAMRGGRG